MIEKVDAVETWRLKNSLGLDLRNYPHPPDVLKALEGHAGFTLTGSRVFRSKPEQGSDHDFFGLKTDARVRTVLEMGFGVRSNQSNSSPGNLKWECVSFASNTLPIDIFLLDKWGAYDMYYRGHMVAKETALRDLIEDKPTFLKIFHAMCGREIHNL